MRRFLGGLLTGLVVACLFFVGIGHILDLEDPLAPADVIVALSGDTGARTPRRPSICGSASTPRSSCSRAPRRTPTRSRAARS